MEWFATWFNSPYYHKLYGHRDSTEAAFFMDNLCKKLKLSQGVKILDIACGQGRHAIHLNKKGFEVIGVDLSEQSIAKARETENDKLHFYVHDIRKMFGAGMFDFAFNLFTSFGYFDTQRQHISALKNFNLSLKPNGTLVIDYFNSNKIKIGKLSHEEKQIDNIFFSINKFISDNKIVKTIAVDDEGKKFEFKEEVQAFSLSDFELMLREAGFQIEQIFGAYDMQAFDPESSDRLILVCKK